MVKTVSIRHVLKYTAVFGSVQFLTILIAMVRSMITSRLIGPGGTGLLAIYNDSAQGVASITNLGLPFSAVRNLSEIEDRTKAEHYIMVVRTWALWTGVLGALACIVCAPVLASYLDKETGGAQYVTGIMALAPMVCALAISGGELAILKGMKRLKRVAYISAVGAVTTLCTTIPIYYVLGIEGVIMALVLSTVFHTVVHLCFTVGTFPYKVRIGSCRVWREGWSMVCLGIPYIMAGVAGSIAIMAVTTFLTSNAGEVTVGLYKAGYTLMVTYAGMVFVAVESDYFPRLSAVNHDNTACNAVVNQQVQVCLMLMGPLLILLVMLMPIAVQVLYGEKFMPVVGMAIASVFYMLMRCLSVPVAYLALAKGHSLMYLLMEAIYDVVSVSIIVAGFSLDALEGTGWALSACGLFDALLVCITYTHCYGFRLKMSAIHNLLMHGILLAGAVTVCLCCDSWLRYGLCVPMLLMSMALSLFCYKRQE